MKTSVRNRPVQSALLRIVARAKQLATFQALTLSPTPFADLMLYPDKLEAVTQAMAGWKQRVVLTPRTVSRLLRTKMSPTRRGGARHLPDNPLNGLINTEFRLIMPQARTVQLAGDFTDWEKAPLDLMQAEDGTWFTIVPLLPGAYAYRFIVDGKWHDDPQPEQRLTNSFGTTNAVVTVT